jgi:hypothetical protein
MGFFMKRSSRPIAVIMAMILAVMVFAPAAGFAAVNDSGGGTTIDTIISVGTPTEAAPEDGYQPGATFTVPVNIAGNPGFSSFVLKHSFDSDVFEFASSAGGLAGLATSDPRAGTVAYINIIGLLLHTDINGDGTLYSVTFKVKEDAEGGTYQIGVGVSESAAVKFAGYGGDSALHEIPVAFGAPLSVKVYGEQPPVLIDKDALNAATIAAAAIAGTYYTSGSWSVFAAALEEAQAVAADGGATQEAVDAALAALIDAQGALASIAYWDEAAFEAVSGIDYIGAESGDLTVNTALGLAYFARQVNEGTEYLDNTVTLADDIDVGAYYWVPIGRAGVYSHIDGTTAAAGSFKGTFDGGGHYISNYTIGGAEYTTGSHNEANGLFGINRGTIKNLGLRNVTSRAYRSPGGIAGYNYGTISYCMTTGTVAANGTERPTRASGGIAGYNGGVVSHCYSTAAVSNGPTASSGGIVGGNGYSGGSGEVDGNIIGTVEYSYFAGTATGSATGTGGIAGTVATTVTGGIAAPLSIVANSYYLANSSSNNQPFVWYGLGTAAAPPIPATVGAFTQDGKLVSDTAVSLLSALGAGFKTSGSSYQYPVLAWEEGGSIPSRAIVSIIAKAPPVKLIYTEGETFDPAGFTAEALYDDDTSEPVTDVVYDKTAALTAADTSVTFTAVHDGLTETFVYSIAVKAEPIILTVYEKANGASDSERTVAATYTASQLAALKTLTEPVSGMYYSGGYWRVISTNDYVTLAKLFENAGLASEWKSGASIKIAQGTSFSTAASYEEVAERHWFYPDTVGGTAQGAPIDVPAVLALTVQSTYLTAANAALGIVTAADAEANNLLNLSASGAPRFVYGITEDISNLIGGSIIGGNRYASNVDEITLTKAVVETEHVVHVTFDPVGGTFAEGVASEAALVYGAPYGALPIPEKDRYEFLGWALGDTPITSASIVSAQEDHTLTATYKQLVGAPGSGDLDGDGAVTTADSTKVLQAVVGLAELSEAQFAAADLDGDGILTMRDVMLIMRKTIGL